MKPLGWNLKDAENYLEHDIRMDMDEFYKFDATIFEDYIKVGKKADSIATVLKFLRRWKMKFKNAFLQLIWSK